MDSQFQDSRVQFQQSQVDQSYYQNPMNEKTFLTNNQVVNENIWKPFDFLFPAGKLAKLVRVYDAMAKMPWGAILYKLKLTEGFPVINLIGAKECGRGKFYAGIARAAFNTDAIVVDSAIQTGIEKYAIRRGVKLIGVAPENEIKFPKINPTFVDPLEISNGHTHLFLLNTLENDFKWTQEVWFKTDLCVRLAEGCGPKGTRRKDGKPRCKVVHVLLADSPNYLDELKLAVRQQLPIIVVKGSRICNEIIRRFGPKDENQQNQNGQQQNDDVNDDQNSNQDMNDQNQQQQSNFNQGPIELDPELLELFPGNAGGGGDDDQYNNNQDQQNEQNRGNKKAQKGHFYYLDSEDSEDIAQFLHFLLTVTPYEDGSLIKPSEQDRLREEQLQQQQQQQDMQNQQQNDDQDGDGGEQQDF